MNENVKLQDLELEEATKFIAECFALVGLSIGVKSQTMQLAMSSILKFHGRLNTALLYQMFSDCSVKRNERYAKLKPVCTSYFINQLREVHFDSLKKGGNAPEEKTANPKPAIGGPLTNREKYIDFYMHCDTYQSMPGNPDWVAIYEHLVVKKWLLKPAGFEEMDFAEKWKHAMQEVSDFANKKFQLTNVLVRNTSQRGNLNISGASKRIKN